MHRIVSRMAAVALAGAACFVIAQSAPVPARPNTPRNPEPFTAEFKTTTVQTLADGTTITREVTEIQTRDSEGRSMRSTTGPMIGGEGLHRRRPPSTILSAVSSRTGIRAPERHR